MSYPLQVDIAIVEKQGIPVELCEDYFAIGEGRTAHLTPRGIAMYQYALKRYGIDFDLASIRVVKDITALNRRLVDARTRELWAACSPLSARERLALRGIAQGVRHAD